MEGQPPIADNLVTASTSAVSARSTEQMLDELEAHAAIDFRTYEHRYESFINAALSEVGLPKPNERSLVDELEALHNELLNTRIAGSVRALESWSDGEQSFKLVPKSWGSVVDKLYRMNWEENALRSRPPILPTVEQRAEDQSGDKQRWITPDMAHLYADDLIRTKFVVPFADGVVSTGRKLEEAFNRIGLRRYRRFHAKDTGYHAQHYYVLCTVPAFDGEGETTIAVEVKVLTKLQDLLGELTHRLYELHRTGAVPAEKKRKYAWQLGSLDFKAAYLGHTAHFLEASICDLKTTLYGEDA